MSRIFKNMIPYWKSIIIIFALLFVQAWCDLALPSYTSDIIDVGIQNSGVEHIVPEALTAEAFETAESKFAHAMDNLQPLMLNNSNDGGDWREHGVSAKQVYGRQDRTKEGSEKLYEITEQIIKKHVEKGNLK